MDKFFFRDKHTLSTFVDQTHIQRTRPHRKNRFFQVVFYCDSQSVSQPDGNRSTEHGIGDISMRSPSSNAKTIETKFLEIIETKQLTKKV